MGSVFHASQVSKVAGSRQDFHAPVRISGWNRAVCHDSLHHEGGGHSLYARKDAELVVLQRMVGGEVGGDDAQQVVGVTEQALGGQDAGNGGQSRFEGPECSAILLLHRDEDERLEGEAEGCCVDDGTVATDDTAAFKFAEASMTGREAQTHPAGQVSQGETAVILQQRKDLSVYGVPGPDPSTRCPIQR